MSLYFSLSGRPSSFFSSFWDSRQFYTFIHKAHIGHLGLIKWGRLLVQKWVELVPALKWAHLSWSWLVVQCFTTDASLIVPRPRVRRCGSSCGSCSSLMSEDKPEGAVGLLIASFLIEDHGSDPSVGLPAVELVEPTALPGCLGLQWKTLEKGAHSWGRVGAVLLVGMASSRLTAFIFALLVHIF